MERIISEAFAKFRQQKILVVGDVMVDSYIWGSCTRISPEAPVPIVDIDQREERAGGAANVALNIKALGGQAIICSVVGNDKEGIQLNEIIHKEGISTRYIIKSNYRSTSIKHRIIAGNQQLLRIDSENTHPLNDEELNALALRYKAALKHADLVIFQDYDKGVLNEKNIELFIEWAKEEGVPTTVDPKKRNFLSYQKATLFKPNFKELNEGLGLNMIEKNITELIQAFEQFSQQSPTEGILCTLSEKGALIKEKDQFFHFDAHPRKIVDVSGAGDTVISIVSICMSAGMPMPIAAYIANIGGGMVCEYQGVISIQHQQLKEECIRIFKALNIDSFSTFTQRFCINVD